ncbi:MAG: phospho-sugar mutase [Bacteroidetes bacterium]|nr:phospho-sugar mutase [Bacteroidota bacterium]
MTPIDRAKNWLNLPFDAETQKAVQQLIKNDRETLNDAFYKELEFGTGGMRGVLGVGTNRINAYTLGRATQGLADYLNHCFGSDPIAVVIAFDCRHQSEELSRLVSEIFSANSIQVYLFSALRTTPELSFAVRHLRAHAGIVLTASHNPPEYNGYKVYWKDGGQIVPPQDQEIIDYIGKVDYSDIQFKGGNTGIQLIDKEVDEAFFKASVAHGRLGKGDRNAFSLVFTPIHGTSITAIPQVFEMAGYTQVYIVEEQAVIDPNFSTVKSPNPEEHEALKMALSLAEKKKADMVIGTDPDSDRLGVAVRGLKGEMLLLNGNQTMVVLTEYLLQHHQKEGLNGNEFIASSIVSTPLLRKMAEAYKVHYHETLTGFKWIGKLINDHPELKFLGGGEESYGYLVGDFVRDKDAVTASLLAAEIAAELKAKGQTLLTYLIKCFVTYGCYQERLLSITKKGQSGAQEIEAMMQRFRAHPPEIIADERVLFTEDYLTQTKTNQRSKEQFAIDLPKADVFILETENGTRIAARPSGTEPKIKFYFSVNEPLHSAADYTMVKDRLETRIDRLIEALEIS